MEEKKDESKQVDELTIIRSCMTQLNKLSPAAQRRVVEYLRAKAFEGDRKWAVDAPVLPKSKDEDAFG